MYNIRHTRCNIIPVEKEVLVVYRNSKNLNKLPPTENMIIILFVFSFFNKMVN